MKLNNKYSNGLETLSKYYMCSFPERQKDALGI